MRISDWRSDVCASDLARAALGGQATEVGEGMQVVGRVGGAPHGGGVAGPRGGRGALLGSAVHDNRPLVSEMPGMRNASSRRRESGATGVRNSGLKPLRAQLISSSLCKEEQRPAGKREVTPG